jgi:hypothetical protein
MVAAIVVVLGRVGLSRPAPQTSDTHDDEVDGPRAASTCQDKAVELII